MRRAGEYGTIRIIHFNGAVPVPQKLEKIWPSSANKESLQLVARDISLTESEFPNVLSSSIIIKDELLTAQLKIDGSDVSNKLASIENGARRNVALSNDADTICVASYM